MTRTAVSIGSMVNFRSRTGDYTIPAVVSATVDSINPEGVARGRVPELTAPLNLHLVCFTPGTPGLFAANGTYRPEPPKQVLTRIDPTKPLGDRAVPVDAPSEPQHIRVAAPFGGTYAEWNVPLSPAFDGVDLVLWPSMSRDLQIGRARGVSGPQEPGTWEPGPGTWWYRVSDA